VYFEIYFFLDMRWNGTYTHRD